MIERRNRQKRFISVQTANELLGEASEYEVIKPIPITIWKETYPPLKIMYGKFADPTERSVIVIPAGGPIWGITYRRIIVQMIHYLKTIETALQQPNPPLNAHLIKDALNPYFRQKDLRS